MVFLGKYKKTLDTKRECILRRNCTQFKEYICVLGYLIKKILKNMLRNWRAHFWVPLNESARGKVDISGWNQSSVVLRLLWINNSPVMNVRINSQDLNVIGLPIIQRVFADVSQASHSCTSTRLSYEHFPIMVNLNQNPLLAHKTSLSFWKTHVDIKSRCSPSRPTALT